MGTVRQLDWTLASHCCHAVHNMGISQQRNFCSVMVHGAGINNANAEGDSVLANTVYFRQHQMYQMVLLLLQNGANPLFNYNRTKQD